MKTLLYNKTSIIDALSIIALALFGIAVFFKNSIQPFLFTGAILVVLVNLILMWRFYINDKKQKADLRYKQNQLFSTLLDNTSSVVFVKDLEGRYLFVNKECEKRFHIVNEEVIGKTDFEIFSKEISEKYLETDREVIESQSVIEREERSVHADGLHTYINTKFPLYDSDNKFYAICGIGTDITSRKKAEEEIIHAKEEAEHAREMEEHFLANASHEIRTPMNGIIGMTRQLLESKLTRQQIEITNTVIDSANNLLAIINDLLDLSKIKAGKMELEKVDFRLSDILNRLDKSLQHIIRENHINFHYQIDQEIPEVLSGDSVKITQILTNLIGNSIKFTYEGKVMVDVKLKSKNSNQLELEFNVRDTGIGIPKDKVDRIFDSFSQVNQLGNRKYSGTGLGLTIAKQLVEQQGGTITVNSKLGQGTVFTFTLFLEKGSLEHLLFLEKHKTENLSPSADFSNATILLVEDNKINQRVAAHELRKWKANVEIANDANEAIQILGTKKIDVVLMDLSMPGMDGYEATVHIRTKMDYPIKNVPIIAMTASALSDEKDKCFQIGMNDYISKPFEPSELHQKLVQYLDVKEIQSEKKNEIISDAKKIATYELLKEHADGDVNYMTEILSDCLKEFPVYMAELNEANEIRDWPEVRQAAHKMKAPIALIGAERIKTILENIEANVIKNQFIETIPTQVKALNKLMILLYEEITLELEKLHLANHL